MLVAINPLSLINFLPAAQCYLNLILLFKKNGLTYFQNALLSDTFLLFRLLTYFPLV